MASAGVFVLLLLPALGAGTYVSRFLSARDYLSVTSENYPGSYPGPDSWAWQWSVAGGLWAVVFLDFQLPCPYRDRLVISDPGSVRNLTFSCGNPPPIQKEYLIKSPEFTMQLFSDAETDLQPRRFKCTVLYATTRGELQSKIDDLKRESATNAPSPSDDGGLLSGDMVVVVLILLIVPLFVIIVIGTVVLLWRRHVQQSTTNTSLHLNIGAIRRDSSVSYTRHGNGPPPGGARHRLDSDSSLTPAPRPCRPAKRSDSNASWAMRAEMNTSFRHGSCGDSDAGGHHHHAGTVPNLYTPCPGEGTFPGDDLGGFPEEVRSKEGRRRPGLCRLSTICEESGQASKLSGSFPAPLQADQPSLSITNAGYMVMTSCSTNYANC